MAGTARELRYNLARSYMDAGRYLDAVPVLADLYAQAPDQFRFGVQLAQCYRVLGLVAELRALVERLTAARQAAAVQAGEELRWVTERLKARQGEAGALDGEGRIDPDRLADDERREYDRLRLLARFKRFDPDYLMGWVLIAEGEPEQALAHLKRAERADARRPGLLSLSWSRSWSVSAASSVENDVDNPWRRRLGARGRTAPDRRRSLLTTARAAARAAHRLAFGSHNMLWPFNKSSLDHAPRRAKLVLAL